MDIFRFWMLGIRLGLLDDYLLPICVNITITIRLIICSFVVVLLLLLLLLYGYDVVDGVYCY